MQLCRVGQNHEGACRHLHFWLLAKLAGLAQILRDSLKGKIWVSIYLRLVRDLTGMCTGVRAGIILCDR